jgi:hypothetical protein
MHEIIDRGASLLLYREDHWTSKNLVFIAEFIILSSLSYF